MPTTKPSPDGTSEAPARKRRGFPVLPTLLVLLAVPTMIGFGVWQLQRMQWKEALLLDLARNADAPLAELIGKPIPDDAQFRKVRLLLACEGGVPGARAGRNLEGQSGYSHLRQCQTSGVASPQAVALDIGWSIRPDLRSLPPSEDISEGTLVRLGEAGWILVRQQADPRLGLVASAPPGPETISNNHRSYAVQWFSFAAILATIYGLWLRRWLARPGPQA